MVNIGENEYGQLTIVLDMPGHHADKGRLRLLETTGGGLRISADFGNLVVRPGGGQNVIEVTVE